MGKLYTDGFTVSLLKRGVNRQTDTSLEFYNVTLQINYLLFLISTFQQYYINITKYDETVEMHGMSRRRKIRMHLSSAEIFESKRPLERH